MKNTSKKLFAMLLALVMSVTCLVSPAMASPAEAQTSETLSESSFVEETYMARDGEYHTVSPKKDTAETRIMVAVDDGSTVFLETSDLELAVAAADDQRAELYAAENAIASVLGESIEVDRYFSLVFNGFSFTGESWMIDAINQIDGLTAMEAMEFQLIEPEDENETIDLTPAMADATNMVGAINAWDLGYTGKGMVVGIIDTGIKQTHEAFNVMPEGAKIDQKYLENVFSQYGNLMHGQNTEGAYYSAKMPYNWDYFQGDADPTHNPGTQNHGSHVAGIVAGNNGKDFKGVAPDAQIISLQVFNNGGGASVDDMLAAMEDCVYLGVDAINMSLGIANGFETYEWPMNFEPVYNALEKAGVAVCVAASNDAHAYISTMFGNWNNVVWQWSSMNPDNGLIGTPGTYVGSFTVGNSENLGREAQNILKLNGREFSMLDAYYPQYAKPFDDLAAGEYDIVNIGNGSISEINAAGSLSGKIALAKRDGSTTFSKQASNAAAAGAVGIVVYNNIPGVLDVANPSCSIHFGTLSLAEGEAIIAAMGEANSCKITLSHDFSYKAALMSSSSSWGPTAQLSLKPDISAPGASINSVDGTVSKTDDAYTKKTGTSMATPAVAGGTLLMKQHLKTMFPNATAAELNELVYAFLMSTAGEANAFVRQQGSGAMDLVSATSTKAYLTSTEDKRPKLELDDSDNGEFAISFKLHNADTVDRTYDIGFSTLTEDTFTMEFRGYYSSRQPNRTWLTPELSKRWGGYWLVNPTPEIVTLCNGSIKDVTEWCTLEGEKSVTVKAGETVTINLTLKAGAELKEYFAKNCPDGMYMEGWIKLTDKSAANNVDLSIPYLGFYGDWDYPAVIDDGWWWQDEYGVNNMAQMYNSNIVGGTFLGYGDAEQGLGLNYYWDETGETYLSDRNAISPNGDGMLDAITTLEMSLLRQPRRINVYIEYEDGTTMSVYDKSYSFRKETHPVGSATAGGGLGYSGLYWDYNASELEENETAYYVVEAYLDHDEFKLEDNKRSVLRIPFYRDTTAPVVTAVDGGVEIKDANYVAYYAIYTDARCTEKVFEDGVFAMERGVAETYKTDLNKYFVAVADYARNEAFYYVEDGVAYELDGEGFDHGRTIIGETWRKYYSQTDNEDTFAWYSVTENLDRMPQQLTPITTTSDDLEASLASSDILAVGKAADGTIYASSMGFLYTFDPVTFEKTKIAQYNYPGEKTTVMMSFDVAPGTNDLYGIVSHSGSAMSKTWFVSINPETAEVTHLWEIKLSRYKYCFDFYDSDTIIIKQTYSKSQMGFELFNLDGTSEGVIDKGWAIKSASGGNTKTTLGGHVGYTTSLLYDAENEVVFMGGNWSYSYDDRGYQNVIAKVDLTTGQITWMTTGMNGGIGLMSLYFLEDVMEVPEQEHICYTKTVAPTCSADGYTVKICAECGKEIEKITIPASSHDYEAVVTDPTCTTLGYTTYTCKTCGHSYKDNYTPATDHTYGQWETVKAATCTEKGQEKRVCVCGKTEYRDTDKLEHSYEAEVIEPTCTEMGYTIYTCACGHSYIADLVKATGHSYTSVVTAPTCTEQGYTTYTCHCGETYTDDYVDALGHTFGEWVLTTEPGCTEAGVETRTCHCGETETREVPAFCPAEAFADVNTELWYHEGICYVLKNGLMQGRSATVFAPVSNMTRAELAVVMYRVAGSPSMEGKTNPFADVNEGAWYYDAVTWAFEAKVVKGISDAAFAPNAEVTREQVATVLFRFAGAEAAEENALENYTDADQVSEYAMDAMNWAVATGLIKGMAETTLAPQGNASRAQIATILMRYCES